MSVHMHAIYMRPTHVSHPCTRPELPLSSLLHGRVTRADLVGASRIGRHARFSPMRRQLCPSESELIRSLTLALLHALACSCMTDIMASHARWDRSASFG
jgi:hypothetical protein